MQKFRRDPQVLASVRLAEKLIANAGIPAICTRCFAGELSENVADNGGCCSGCKLLGPHGCTEKPLSCALWLCSYLKERFPALNEQLKQIGKTQPNEIVYAPRYYSLESEQARLVQIEKFNMR